MLNSPASIIYNNLNYNYHIFQDIHLKELKKLKVVIIDDNIKDIALTKELLEVQSNINFTILSHTNPHHALLALESKFILPDIIILDLIMPSIDGNIVLKRLKEIAHIKNIPVIIHSSMNNYENIIKMNKLEAHAFFEKPLNIEAFESFILGTL